LAGAVDLWGNVRGATINFSLSLSTILGEKILAENFCKQKSLKQKF
jgi:hypothetical protein